jgi:CheY-like chemotaxis protein
VNNRFSGRRVLLVEDEPIVAWLLKDMLVDLGCSVVGPAADVNQALAMIDAESIDVAVLDVNLRALASGQNSNGSKGLSSTEASDLCADSRNACRTGVFSNGRTDKICRKV